MALLLYALQDKPTTAKAFIVVRASSDASSASSLSHIRLIQQTRAAILSPQSIDLAADQLTPQRSRLHPRAPARTDYGSRDERRKAAAFVRGNLRLVDLNDGSGKLEVSFAHRDPALAAGVLTAVVENFLDLCKGGASRELLRKKLAYTSLNAATLAAASRNPEPAAPNVGQRWTVIQQRIQSLAADFSSARSRLAETRAAATYIKSRTRHADVSLSDQIAIQSLLSEQDQAAADVEVSKKRYGPLHPTRIAAERRLSDADTALAAAASDFKGSAKVAARSTVKIRRALVAARSALAQEVATSDKHMQLLEDTRIAQRRLISTRNHRNSLSNVDLPRAYLVGGVTTDHGPRVSFIRYLFLGVLAGLLAGALILWALESRQIGLRSPNDVTKVLRVRFAGAVPTLDRSGSRGEIQLIDLPLVQPASEFGRVFRHLVQILDIAKNRENGLVVATCSAVANEGKTTASICLGRSASLEGLRVVLVDCDGRRRQLSEAFNFQPTAGLVQLVDGTSSVEAALFKDLASGTHVIGYSSHAEIEHSLFSSRSKLVGVIESLTKQFDLIVLDTPPLLALAEARVFADLSDQIVLVAKWRATPAKMVREALSALESSRREMALALLTFVRFAPS